jgi:hypothetical protein
MVVARALMLFRSLPVQVMATAPNKCPVFSSESIYAGFLNLETHLISRLKDYGKRKETPENSYLKLIWTVLDLCGLLLNSAGGPGLTSLHRADQPIS